MELAYARLVDMELFIAVLASLFSVVNPTVFTGIYFNDEQLLDQGKTRVPPHTTMYFTMICIIFFLGILYPEFLVTSIPVLRLGVAWYTKFRFQFIEWQGDSC